MLPIAEIGALALKNWKLIAGGVALAVLGLLLVLARADASHWHKLADQRAATIAQVALAEKQADALARKQLADTEQRYKENAHVADTTHDAQLADARSAADRYIASHRVPACVAGSASLATAPTAQGGSARVPASVPGDPIVVDASDVHASVPGDFVVVDASDVQACTSAARYALDAHDWALTLK